MTSARIVITGADGQVGWELARSLSPLGEIYALRRADCDLSEPASLRAALDALRPDLVCNAAAYTSVDRAETEPDLAHRVNATAVGEIGQWAARHDAMVLHFSTDYVFDGEGNRPYTEEDSASPRSEYGRSKLKGENLLIASGAATLVCRTSWVYATRGQNFLKTVLRLARERDQLRIVGDQRGSPTWARWLADAAGQLLGRVLSSTDSPNRALRRLGGILHLSAAGETTWHGFAQRILELDPMRHEHKVRSVEKIHTHEYPTAARRPTYSVLDGTRAESYGIVRPHWEAQLRLAMDA